MSVYVSAYVWVFVYLCVCVCVCVCVCACVCVCVRCARISQVCPVAVPPFPKLGVYKLATRECLFI